MVKRQTNRQKLRGKFLWLHRWLGLISGIVVLVVALTGCLYVFEKEARELFQYKYYHVTAGKTSKKNLQQLQDIIHAKFPPDSIRSIRFTEKADAAYIIATSTNKNISINPYTGEVIGIRNTKKDFFGIILRLHRTLLLGHVGEQIIRWNVLLFFILCISGLILWWPKQKRFFRRAATIKFSTKNSKRLNWDLHSVLGFYALLILFIISLTGLFWVFDTVKTIVRFATHEPSPKKEEKLKSRPAAGKSFPADIAYQQMKGNYPGAKETFIVLPADSLAPMRIIMQYPYTLVRNQNNIFFDQYSGKILKETLYKNYSAYDKVSRSNYQLHTGDIPMLGIGSKIIYFLAGLFAASLPVTGFMIWLNRNKKVVSRQSSVNSQQSAVNSLINT